MLYALIRKELRLHRMAILAAIAVALVANVLLPSLNDALRRHDDPTETAARRQHEFVQTIYYGSGVALLTTCLFAAIFGGASTTTERRERWTDFTAMLPVPRGRRLAAAAIVGVALASAVFAFHATILLALDARGANALGGSTARHVWQNGAMAIGTLGLARLLATWFRSSALLITIACGTLVAGLTMAIFVNDTQPYERMRPWIDYVGRYLTGVAIVGALTLIASFPIAARRVEP